VSKRNAERPRHSRSTREICRPGHERETSTRCLGTEPVEVGLWDGQVVPRTEPLPSKGISTIITVSSSAPAPSESDRGRDRRARPSDRGICTPLLRRHRFGDLMAEIPAAKRGRGRLLAEIGVGMSVPLLMRICAAGRASTRPNLLDPPIQLSLACWNLRHATTSNLSDVTTSAASRTASRTQVAGGAVWLFMMTTIAAPSSTMMMSFLVWVSI
jgi:hypothetical protein